MQIIRNDPTQETPMETPLFRGSVRRRALVSQPQSEQLTAGIVRFEPGGRAIFHTHSFDQVLYITEGEGIVATEHEEHTVRAGDVAVIPAGEKHWHGASERTTMAHLAIGTPGTTQVSE